MYEACFEIRVVFKALRVRGIPCVQVSKDNSRATCLVKNTITASRSKHVNFRRALSYEGEVWPRERLATRLAACRELDEATSKVSCGFHGVSLVDALYLASHD